MVRESDRQLATVLARHVVAHAAPGELPLFEVTSDAFFTAPGRAGRAFRRSEPLGFGLETAVTVVSTIALTVTVDVLKEITTRHAERLVSSSASRVGRVLRRRFARRSRQSAEPLPSLDQEQLAALRELAYRRALELRASDEQAARIADGIVSALAGPTSDP
ncbi:hypothetical protein [Microbispora sp. H10670]|uniref:hypothetical protein n=1 Tax=Microbispora sp. H10670 TaxID=2729108 RepID=UPI001602803D|nr:hypothetical protein [Microbispora sp. H10670]